MALARIISRSHQCSRDLALDLLARGYAVEIVSPDAIPDNLADLELRLDAEDVSQLTASVEAHSAAHAASLEFIHHLRAPMGDFIRRPPQAGATLSLSALPVSFNAEPAITGDVDTPSADWRAPQPARAAPEFLPEVEESARLIGGAQTRPAPTQEQSRPIHRDLTNELATKIRGRIKIRIPRPPLPNLKLTGVALKRMMVRAAEWFERAGLATAQLSKKWFMRAGPPVATVFSQKQFWRIGLASAVVILMAIVLGRGIRRESAASADPPSQSQPVKVTAPSARALATGGEQQSAAVPSVAPATRSESQSGQGSTKPAASVAHHASRKSGTVRSRNREEDLVARDTVVYFDRSASHSTVKDSRRRASSNK